MLNFADLVQQLGSYLVIGRLDMSFTTELSQAEPEVFGKALALECLYGMTNSYVRGPRGRNRGAAIKGVEGQLKRARHSGATEEEIRDAIRRGATDPPSAIPERVEEIKRRFLRLV